MRRSFTAALLGLALAGSVTACSPAVQPTEQVPEQNFDQPVEESAPEAPDMTQNWTMPDLRGQDLQSAQDAVQSLTGDSVFFTSSHDASGKGRHQILDRDWQVCTQNVAPGAALNAQSKIDFGVVRVDTETCP
ncbi:PASTA domain-containing protein [Sciscionella sediminilitoris]|uniref:PASTA domain-containing protein n=1 Tax=Sciscionella sediminilitoris TaxID=1445613 RepID=UPI0018D04095|nr:PASTA domain-containing protein [Sciscionella sp. SE31]